MAHPLSFSFFGVFYFLLVSTLLFYAPGSWLIHFSGVRFKRGEAFCFSWVLGYLLSGTLYALCMRFQGAGIYLYLMFGMSACYGFFYLRQDLKSWREPISFNSHWLVYLACVILILGFIWITVREADFSDKGLRLSGIMVGDTNLGPAVAHQVNIEVPPEHPLIGGEKHIYHYIPYIGISIFSKFFSFPPLSLTFIYFQALSHLLLLFSVMAAAFRIFSDSKLRFAAVFYTALVAHFQFRIGYAMGFSYFFWGLIFFSEFLTNRSRTAFIFCVLLWGSVISNLYVLSLMIFPALGIFIILHCFHKSPKTAPLFFLGAGLIASYGFWYLLSFQLGSGIEGNVPLVQIGMPLAERALKHLADFSPEFPAFLQNMKAHLPHDLPTLLLRKMEVLRFLFVYGIEAMSFLVLSFVMLDVALLGFILVMVYVWRKDFLSQPMLSFAGLTGAVGVLCCWFLKWRNSGITHTYPVMSYGLLLFYAVPFAFDFFKQKGKWIAKGLLIAAALYAPAYHIAGKVMGLRNGTHSTLISSERLQGYEVLKNEVPPKELIMHPLHYLDFQMPDGSRMRWKYTNHFFPIFTERRSFFIAPNINDDYAPNRLPGSDAERRMDWEKFFETTSADEAFSILNKYGIHWVVATPEEPLKFSLNDKLKTVYQNSSMSVYRYQ